MNSEPPNIASDGAGPTAFGDGHFGPGDVSSGGGVTRFDDLIGEFADAGLELPPELLDEQRAVFLRPGDVVAGRFEVVKPLGFGGMGAVYHVKDRHLHLEDKALKVMLPSLLRSETAQERFRSEVGISQKLRHESIVTVFDLAEDTDRGIRFFTMEYVPGVTLHRLLNDRGGQLPLPEALDIARQICDALDYAHHYTIHRDLKPQNIMVRADGRIKLLDFGLAKLMSPGRLTKSSMALGTAYYQAPEQSVRLAELDARADLYSLGVILYQMLTSRIPLGMSKPPSQLVRNLPKALDAVVSRCLQPEPEDRYTSAAALRAALGQAAVHRPRPWVYAVVAVLAVAAVAAAWLAFAPGEQIGPIRPIRPIALEPETATPPGPSAPATPAPPVDAQPEEKPAATSPPAPAPPVPAKPAEEPATAPVAAPAPADSTTVAEASAARKAALKAQSAAKSAGAESYAAADLAAGDELLKQAEARDTLREYSAAVASYKAATPKYAQAETLAKQVSAEVAALEAAKTEAAGAKAEADAVGAETWAKVRYKQAAETERAALQTAGRADATEKFSKAKDLYKLAAGETREQGQAIVAAAEKTAEQAKARAQTDDVKQYAAEELAQAEAQIAAAKQAGADYQKAKSALEQAAALFAKAVEVVPARKKAEEEALAAEAARKKAEEDRLAAEKKAEQDRSEQARKQAEAAAKAAPQPGEARTFAGIEMVWIPPGEFMMGSPENELQRQGDEGPQRRVRISSGFWLGKYEVTQAQWQAVMGSNPSNSKGDKLPVEQVSWDDCQQFIRKLNEQGAGEFRLPTEAEWEYACRVGTTTPFSFGETISTEQANYDGNSVYGSGKKGIYREKTTEVGSFRTNAWGLYDMHGNVWEWCQDWYHDSYGGAPSDGSEWESPSGQYRVLRGGSWYADPENCRSANRIRHTPDARINCIGFRVVRIP